MSIRLLFAALIALPLVVAAQPAASQEVRLRIVGTGRIDAPADAIPLAATFWKEGDSQVAADAARDVTYETVTKAAMKAGVPASAIRRGGGNTAAIYLEPVSGPPAPPVVTKVPGGGTTTVTSTSTRFRAAGWVMITASSTRQLAELRRVLPPLVSELTDEQGKLADEAAAKRQAKLKAVAAARVDAQAYAASLGFKTVKLVMIDEAGQLLPAGVGRALESSAPNRLRTEAAEPGFVRVEASVAVEFTLAP